MKLKTSMVVGAVVAASLFGGCRPPATSVARSSGSVALSADDHRVFAVDTDNGVLAIINTGTRAVTTVKVGEQPARVVVDANDTAFVANKGSRSVSVVRDGDTTESARIAVGVEPRGMALTRDGKTLLVVSATSLTRPDVGTLTAIDTATLEKKWELEVGEEPSAVAVINGDHALVSLSKQGEVVEVDLNKGTTVRSGAGIYQAANATNINAGTSGFGVANFQQRAMNDLVATSDGSRVFAPVTWTRVDAIVRPPSVTAPYYESGGPCSIGAVASGGIVTIDAKTTGELTPQVDDVTSCSFTGTTSAKKGFPSSVLSSAANTTSNLQSPVAAVIDPSEQWVVVLSRDSRRFAFMPAWQRDGTNINYVSTGSSLGGVQDVQGAGADGLALSADYKRAYVYSQFDHQLEIFEGTTNDATSQVKPIDVIKVAADLPSMTPALIAGRKLFYDARDTRLSSEATQVACDSCHTEGREDGHVWGFPDGPRQTPSLAGRHLLTTAPYHWSGEFETIGAFNTHTITARMGGTGLSDNAASQLDEYISSLSLPENPLRDDGAADAAQLLRGQAAFATAGCDTCHTGAAMTNNENKDVGTLSLRGTNPDNGVVTSRGFNVPSLLGLGRSAPYLHDGTALTLDARVTGTGDTHGNLAALSGDQKADLVAYLKSL